MATKISKSETLFGQILGDILDLRLAPGSPLRLPLLSEQYETGLTPLRDCLNRLSAEHFVVPEHNKGFRVAPISLGELLDIERTRADLEGSLLSDAIRVGNDAWETGVIGTFHQLSQTPVPSVHDPSDVHDLWTKRHDAFHDALIAAAPSIWKHRFRNQLMLQLSRYHRFIQNGLRELAASHPDFVSKATKASSETMSLDAHEALYKTATDRDAAKARKVFEDHSNISITAFENLKTLVPEDTSMATFVRQQHEEIGQ